MGWFAVGLVWSWATWRTIAAERARVASASAAAATPRTTIATVPLTIQGMLPPSQRKVPS